MLLSNNDIEKIEKKGYNRNYFVKSKKGWLKLKNKDRKCVFHNGKICLIYESRPEGCKLYPLIFNKEYKSAVVDDECPYRDILRFNLNDIKKLYKLILKIESERKIRGR